MLNYATTAKIIKDREEVALQKAEREKVVSIGSSEFVVITILYIYIQLKQAQDKEDRDRKKDRDKAKADKAKRDKAALVNAKRERRSSKKQASASTVKHSSSCKRHMITISINVSLAGCDLGGPRTQIVSRVFAFNISLTTLHLSRKNI